MKLHSCWSKWKTTNWSSKKFSGWLGEEKTVMEELKTQLQQVQVSGSGAFLS